MNYEGRKYVLIAGILFISFVFILRLFWIQVVDGKWKAEAANMAERKVTVYPSRGLIYDRKERLLVANTPVYDLMVVPKEVKAFDTAAFCKLINVPQEIFSQRLTEANASSKHHRKADPGRPIRRDQRSPAQISRLLRPVADLAHLSTSHGRAPVGLPQRGECPQSGGGPLLPRR
jgi:cell division protein FtsI/penicillin-binding protein 2